MSVCSEVSWGGIGKAGRRWCLEKVSDTIWLEFNDFSDDSESYLPPKNKNECDQMLAWVVQEDQISCSAAITFKSHFPSEVVGGGEGRTEKLYFTKTWVHRTSDFLREPQRFKHYEWP